MVTRDRPTPVRNRLRQLGLAVPIATLLISCGETISVSQEPTCTYWDEATVEVAEGSGEATAEEALAAVDRAELPRGEPTMDEDSEEVDGRVEWRFLDDGAERGAAVATLSPWGLWTIESVTRCLG
ncbi:hypothetical protein [Phytoactinopolyspora endophytica]|uniref:hypothetical protein n=1 Tax=Phytoactinopolyspora endophytica TaxID=1642495 RepID=UPI00101CE7AA|nr:hypothetical protein [Phytoactinopolyspora endophytica]